jgi:hypothetical protein
MRRLLWLLPILPLTAPLSGAPAPLEAPGSVSATAADAADMADAGPQALDGQAFHHSFYLHLDLGAQSYTDSSWRPAGLSSNALSSTYNDGSTSSAGLVAELGLGYQDPSGLGIELGVGVSPIETVYAMPVYRLATGGLGSRPLIHTFGARAGWSVFGPNGGDYYFYDDNGNSMTLDGSAGFPTYALCYRLEQMLGGRFSLGLELAYHFARTTVGATLETYNSYTYTTTHTQETFDYSGPSLCLSVGLWPLRPFWGAADVQAQRDDAARRVARAEARAARVRRRFGPSAEDADAPERHYAGADEALAVGQAALDIDQPARARQAFEEAVLLAPESAKAWRGLADAEYALALRRRALPHYERALALGGPDPALKAFIKQLRDRLAAEADQP